MQYADVLATLNDLPATFKRSGTTYAQLSASIALALSRYTQGSDATLAQARNGFSDASGHWLDVWGLLLGVPRHSSEADAAYSTRIEGTLATGAGPPLVIENFVQLTRGIMATVTEALPTVGWALQITGSVPTATLAEIAQDLGRVRPAGVPYTFGLAAGGLYLSTINYLGSAAVTGSYLTESLAVTAPPIPDHTNSTKSPLPTDFMTDPTLNQVA